MKKITEITNEREFISKLRTYYRKARRKGYQRDEISFLGLMEYIGSATSEFEYQSEKYFSVGIRAYDWVHGNSLLSALIDKWENEIEAEKRKKQAATSTEAPRISPENVQTVECTAEGEKAAQTAANEPEGATYNEATQKYYIDTYGTPEAAEARYNAAIAATLAELEEYNANPRKGGKYRKERIARLNDSAEILRKELEDVKRNMRRYMEAHPEITASAGETDEQAANVSPEQGSADRERENEPRAERMKSIDDIFNQWERIHYADNVSEYRKLLATGLREKYKNNIYAVISYDCKRFWKSKTYRQRILSKKYPRAVYMGAAAN